MTDQDRRNLFCTEVDRNFSVIAPAGVGKTTALVDRIACIASQNPEKLTHLYVLSYTNEAAASLERRVQKRIGDNSSYQLHCLKQGFFGTIHSLCLKVIRSLDPTSYVLLTDENGLKRAFMESITTSDPDLARFGHLFRFWGLHELITGTHNRFLSSKANNPSGNSLDLTAIEGLLKYEWNKAPQRSQAAIKKTLEEVDNWLKEYRKTTESTSYVGLPICYSSYKSFKSIFNDAFHPLLMQLETEAVACCRILSERYFQFRKARGYLTYDDYSVWANRCLQTQETKEFYGMQPVNVLLDEAQDTDPLQFEFLKTFCSLHPESQFSMVGDPQQSIYDERADVKSYLAYHRQLTNSKECEALTFSCTHRCPPAIINTLNQRFPRIFYGANNVPYVSLETDVSATGTFKSIAIDPGVDAKYATQQEAQCIEKVLRDELKGYALSDICLLVPRKSWLYELKQALELLGRKVQLHSTQETGRYNPLFCACLTLIHSVHAPEDTFELMGFFHTVLHCPDCDLAYESRKPDKTPNETRKKIDDVKALVQDCAGLSLCEGLERIIDTLKKLCPSSEHDTYFINKVFSEAFEAQQQGQSWATLELRLRSYLDQPVDVGVTVDPDALQGFTYHKAKGLEWETVILPYFYRPYRGANKTYPYAHRMHCVLNSSFVDTEPPLVDVKGDEKRNLQRLLYVALTRAKMNCFWVNDAHVKCGRDGTSEWNESLSFGNLWDEWSSQIK